MRRGKKRRQGIARLFAARGLAMRAKRSYFHSPCHLWVPESSVGRGGPGSRSDTILGRCQTSATATASFTASRKRPFGCGKLPSDDLARPRFPTFIDRLIAPLHSACPPLSRSQRRRDAHSFHRPAPSPGSLGSLRPTHSLPPGPTPTQPAAQLFIDARLLSSAHACASPPGRPGRIPDSSQETSPT